MSRTVTLLGYVTFAVVVLAMQLVAHRTRRLPTFGDALAALTERAVIRSLVLTAWIWLGWHVFVRVDWR